MFKVRPARPSPTRRPCRRGAAVIEFAVVAPVLFVLIFGIIEFGRMLMVAQMATNGSREGARYAALSGYTADEVDTYTRQYLQSAGVSSDGVKSVTIQYYDPGDKKGAGGWVTTSKLYDVTSGTPVKLTVDIDYDKVTWLPGGILVSRGTTLRGTTVMRKE